MPKQPAPDQSDVRERIQTIMQEKNIKPGDLADKMGDHASSISQMLTGKRSISPRNLIKLAEAIGVTAAYLQTGVSNVKPANLGQGELLKGIIESIDLKQKDFARLIGVNPTRLSYILKQEELPRSTIAALAKIKQLYPKAAKQIEELLLVHANTEKPAVAAPRENEALPVSITPRRMVSVPFVPHGLRAGFVEEVPIDPYEEVFIEVEEDETLARYGSKARAFEINGDSMEPTFFPGYRVLGYMVDPGDWEFLHPNAFVVVSYDGGFIIKRINRNAIVGSGILELSSVNPSFGTIEVSVDKIRYIWELDRIIEGKLRGSNFKSRLIRGPR